jgi:hypothetical protein
MFLECFHYTRPPHATPYVQYNVVQPDLDSDQWLCNPYLAAQSCRQYSSTKNENQTTVSRGEIIYFYVALNVSD